MEPVRTCPLCGTICHPTQKAARRSARRGSPERRLRPRRYPAGHGWHLSVHRAARSYPGRSAAAACDRRAAGLHPFTTGHGGQAAAGSESRS